MTITKCNFECHNVPAELTSAEKPTLRALQACANWLVYCLSIGWYKASLDGLEDLWWKYHDRCGEFETEQVLNEFSERRLR